jgi:hypothetical protein
MAGELADLGAGATREKLEWVCAGARKRFDCETLRERRERYGISYLTVFERDMEAFAPVVAQLAGT